MSTPLDKYGVFEDDEGGDPALPPTTALDYAVASFSEEEEADEELREVDRILTKVAYYRQLVKDGVVENDGTEASQEVNQEAILWARTQIAKLFGRQASTQAINPIVSSPFSEQEVEILKQFVGKVVTSSQAKPQPVVKRVQAEPPTVRPVVNKPKAPVAPKPKPKIQAAKPQLVNQSSLLTSVAAKPVVKSNMIHFRKGMDYDDIPTEIIFKERGRFYKFIPHPTNSDERIKQSISTQVLNPEALPMPSSSSEWELVTANQAGSQVTATGKIQKAETSLASHFLK